MTQNRQTGTDQVDKALDGVQACCDVVNRRSLSGKTAFLSVPSMAACSLDASTGKQIEHRRLIWNRTASLATRVVEPQGSSFGFGGADLARADVCLW
jgi:hypothetical protein